MTATKTKSKANKSKTKVASERSDDTKRSEVWTPRRWSKEFRTAIPWNAEQLAVFDAVENTEDNLVIEAVAGAGKCIHPETLLAVNGELKTALSVWKEFHGTETFDGEGYVSVPKDSLYVDSYDETTRKFVRKPVLGLYRQKVEEPLRKVFLSDGSSITLTKAHKLFDGQKWLNDYQVGQTIAVPNNLLSEQYAISPALAIFLGWFLGKGHTSKIKYQNSQSFDITQKDKSILEKLAVLINEIEAQYSLFPSKKELRHHEDSDTWRLRWSSKEFSGLLKAVGCDLEVLSNEKSVPKALMQSHNNSVRLFLQAFFDAEGHVQESRKNIELTSASKLMIKQISYLLRRFGVWSTWTAKKAAATNGSGITRQYYRLTIDSVSLRKFAEEIGLGYAYKQKALDQIIQIECNPNKELLPTVNLVAKLLQDTKMGFRQLGLPDPLYATTKQMSRFTASKVVKHLQSIKAGQRFGGNQLCPVSYVSIEAKKAIETFCQKLTALSDSSLEFPKIVRIEEFLYQGDVYDFQVQDTQNFVAENILCHNSTVLKALIGLLPSSTKVNVLMFNVSVKDAFAEDPRVPKRVNVSTAHGYCQGMLIGKFKGEMPKLEEDKSLRLANYGQKKLKDAIKQIESRKEKKILPEAQEAAELILERWRDELKKLIDFARLNLSAPDEEALDFICGYFAIRFPFGKWGKSFAIAQAIELLEVCFREGLYEQKIDYTDMLWLTYRLGLKPRPPAAEKAVLLIDELQDASPAMLSLYNKFKEAGYRLIGVGDRRQSISGAYSGARNDSMDKFVDMTNAKSLPLAETQRCPKSHAALASLIVSDIRARQDAKVGSCNLMHPDTVRQTVEPGNLVICRFVAPLIKLFLQAKFFEGKEGIVRSRDVAREMSRFASQICGRYNKWSDFADRLAEQKEYQVNKLRDGLLLTQADAWEDRFQCLEYCYQYLGKGTRSLDEFTQRLTEAFPQEAEDRSRHIIYSSIHSAKGDEASKVVIVGANILPYQRPGMLKWMFAQEVNATYVAITRSKSELIFVPLDRTPEGVEALLAMPLAGMQMEYFPNINSENSQEEY